LFAGAVVRRVPSSPIAMHTLLFLEPGHFHATLTLGRPHPRVSDEVIVYAAEGAERRDFLALVERFNRRAEGPTSWRPRVVSGGDLLARLVSERRGDVVVLAGRNGGKARTIRRLHEAGFHVLADKPWLVEPDDLADIRASLTGWPLVMEIMTGRHDVAARLFKRLVDARDVFGGFRDDGPAIVLESTHCLEKLVDGAPLRRPWWFFDVRVQGSGAVDIPTHVVDQAQWLLEGDGVAPGAAPRLVSARAWPTPVPLDAFRRITGEPDFPGALRPLVAGDELSYLCNAELAYAIGPVAARATVSWRVSSPDGGGDTHATAARGTRADVLMARGASTGHRRRLRVQPHADAEHVRRAMIDVVDAVRRELPGVEVAPAGVDGIDVTIPRALDAGHESHFALVLDDFLTIIDGGRWPAALAERTLAKYALLAQAAAATRANAGRGGAPRRPHETEKER
jgi:predicted dehydrogenase